MGIGGRHGPVVGEGVACREHCDLRRSPADDDIQCQPADEAPRGEVERQAGVEDENACLEDVDEIEHALFRDENQLRVCNSCLDVLGGEGGIVLDREQIRAAVFGDDV